MTEGYAHKGTFFVDTLARGIAAIAASQYPKPVVVRTSDFKSNEYAQLIGGPAFEPHEDNPMLGFRGASRYRSADYGPAFALECQALKRARECVGLDNVVVMLPFVRTVDEADRRSDVARRLGIFDERNAAVKRAITSVITVAHRHGCKIGICGQAPSDYPDFARFLVECGIDSISLNPDSVLSTLLTLSTEPDGLSRTKASLFRTNAPGP